jgi:hypothetical protein
MSTEISRRDFLKFVGLGAAGLALDLASPRKAGAVRNSDGLASINKASDQGIIPCLAPTACKVAPGQLFGQQCIAYGDGVYAVEPCIISNTAPEPSIVPEPAKPLSPKAKAAEAAKKYWDNVCVYGHPKFPSKQYFTCLQKGY